MLKRFVAVFVTMVCTFSFSFQSSAKTIDISEWIENENLTMVADPNIPSNSGLKFAQLKVKYDYPSNRIIMLFMLSFSPFTQEEFPEIRFRLNGGDELSVNLNGETEYNAQEYYLEFISKADYSSGNVWFEIVFGVKDGIPERRELTVVFYDPSGVPSNTYTVSLNDETEPSSEEPANKAETQSRYDKNNNKTQQKTEKTQKTKTTESKETASAVMIDGNAQEKSNSDKGSFVSEKVLFIAASAVILTGLLVAGGMHCHKRKKHKGDKG